jgi:putative FmdB family regulatory protein
LARRSLEAASPGWPRQRAPSMNRLSDAEDTMPTYEYHCEACDHDFMAVLGIAEHDKAKPPCPKCKSNDKVFQLVSAVQVKTSRKS